MPVNDPPQEGTPTESEAQGSLDTLLQTASTADGNGAVALTDGYNGCQMLEIQKTGTGTCSLTPQGSYDQIAWYSIGYYQVDGQASLARTVGPIAVPAGTLNHVYQLLDLYPYTRCLQSGTTGAVSVQARLYAVPV